MTRRSRRGLVGVLAAEAVSLSGTRLSAIALPWFVLVSTGSATKTGLVAFCEMAPYVVAKTLAGPITDRVGPRRVSVGTDLVSAVLVGAVPVLHLLGALHFGVLLGLVALIGVARGPGDSAKSVMIPQVVEEARVPLERGTGLAGTIERLASTVGAAGAGAVVAVLGPAVALAIDAVSFLVAALVIVATVRPRRPSSSDVPSEELDEGSYVQRLRAGFAFLWRERLLRSIAAMVGVTNLLDAAMVSVLLPVWAYETGRGPVEVGLVLGVLSGFSIVASLVAAALAHRLPRRATYLIGFFVAGAPRFVVLALGAPLWLVLVVSAVGGLGSGFLNPILGAVIWERIPTELRARVSGITTSVAWAGIPLGGLIGGALIALAGLTPALLLCGAVYFLATTLPGLQPEWKRMDERRGKVLAHG